MEAFTATAADRAPPVFAGSIHASRHRCSCCRIAALMLDLRAHNAVLPGSRKTGKSPSPIISRT